MGTGLGNNLIRTGTGLNNGKSSILMARMRRTNSKEF
jgi:hypothetical protein